MAHRHPEPRHPPLLGRLSSERPAADNAAYYQGPAARWYDALYGWRTEDVPFYQRLAQEWAGPRGSVLELGAGAGRVSLPLARAGFQVTAVDSSPEMLDCLLDRLAAEPEDVRRRVEPVQQDIRRLSLDRLYRFVCLPFNTLLMLSRPQDLRAALDGVREHLAPSGAFGFDIFTPDPARLAPAADWELDIEHDADDPRVGAVHVRRDLKRDVDLGRQLMGLRFRHRITPAAGGDELAAWEDEIEIAYVFPRELDLALERHGLRVTARHGGPDMRPYEPSADEVQPQYVVARLQA